MQLRWPGNGSGRRGSGRFFTGVEPVVLWRSFDRPPLNYRGQVPSPPRSCLFVDRALRARKLRRPQRSLAPGPIPNISALVLALSLRPGRVQPSRLVSASALRAELMKKGTLDEASAMAAGAAFDPTLVVARTLSPRDAAKLCYATPRLSFCRQEISPQSSASSRTGPRRSVGACRRSYHAVESSSLSPPTEAFRVRAAVLLGEGTRRRCSRRPRHRHATSPR